MSTRPPKNVLNLQEHSALYNSTPKFDAEAGKDMMKIEGVEALEDFRWIEIVVGVCT